MSKLVTTIGTAAVVLSTNAYAVNPNSGQTSTGQTLNIEITSPTSSDDVDINEALAVEGLVNIGAVPSTGLSNVTFVIDVSGSTDDSTDNDCNNDGQVDDGDNFTPADSAVGTILDCEIGAVMALNDSLGSDPSVSTSVILFGANAATAQDFVSPPDADTDGNGIADIDDTLVQVDQGGGIVDVSFTTDFNNALEELIRLMETRPADQQRVAYFLTDGADFSSVTTTATAASDAGIRVETFSVGNGAEPCAGSTLADIANITGGTCTDVQDIDTLTAVIGNTGGVPPTGIANVTLSINGGVASDVAVDNLGNWQGTIEASELASGANTLEATAFADDGTAVIADLTFNAMDSSVTTPDITTPVTPDPEPTTPVTPDPVPTTPVTPDPDPIVTAPDPVVTTPVTPDPTPVMPTTPAMPMMMGPIFCANGAASDSDGDGFGFENNMSCLVQSSAFDLARVVHPACTRTDSDFDGDGFGFENNATCIVPGSAASQLVD